MFIVVTFIEEILALHTLFSWWTSDRKYFERNRRIQLRGIVKRGHGWPSRWCERLWQFRGQSTEDCYDCVTYGFSTRIADGWFIQTSDGTSSKLVRYFIHLVTLLTVPQERALLFHFFYYSSLHREIARTIKRARVYLLRKFKIREDPDVLCWWRRNHGKVFPSINSIFAESLSSQSSRLIYFNFWVVSYNFPSIVIHECEYLKIIHIQHFIKNFLKNISPYKIEEQWSVGTLKSPPFQRET